MTMVARVLSDNEDQLRRAKVFKNSGTAVEIDLYRKSAEIVIRKVGRRGGTGEPILLTVDELEQVLRTLGFVKDDGIDDKIALCYKQENQP